MLTQVHRGDSAPRAPAQFNNQMAVKGQRGSRGNSMG